MAVKASQCCIVWRCLEKKQRKRKMKQSKNNTVCPQFWGSATFFSPLPFVFSWLKHFEANS